MIKNLKKNHEHNLFSTTGAAQRKTFYRQRQRMAEITQNPRLLKIHFHTLRHWRASGQYEKTGDIYSVKDLLGHKCIGSTDRYQHGTYQNEEYIPKWAKSRKDEEDLSNAGYQFVRYDQKEDAPIYRKRK